MDKQYHQINAIHLTQHVVYVTHSLCELVDNRSIGLLGIIRLGYSTNKHCIPTECFVPNVYTVFCRLNVPLDPCQSCKGPTHARVHAYLYVFWYLFLFSLLHYHDVDFSCGQSSPFTHRHAGNVTKCYDNKIDG